MKQITEMEKNMMDELIEAVNKLATAVMEADSNHTEPTSLILWKKSMMQTIETVNMIEKDVKSSN